MFLGLTGFIGVPAGMNMPGGSWSLRNTSVIKHDNEKWEIAIEMAVLTGKTMNEKQ
jgi:hypothetical protein